jgi:acetyltransferase-like isoleucine patch superfamily enzyme
VLVIGKKIKRLFRLFLFPLGFLKKCLELANNGARDLENKLRFKDAIIDKGSSFSQNTNINSNVHILEKCIINNSEIKSYTYVGKNCLIQNTRIGKFCSIANDVSIGLGNHPLDFFSTSPLFYRKSNPLKIELVSENSNFEEYKQITIGNDVWIGANSIILDGVEIGDGSIIAANSVVTKNVKPYSIVGGVPAKVIKYRFSEEKIRELKNLKWWELSLNQIKIHFNI